MLENVEETTEEIKKVVEYVPTPYRATQWEGIEKVDRAPSFKKLSVEVVNNFDDFDPMFERFDVEAVKDNSDGDSTGEIEQDPVITEEMFEEVRLEAYQEGFEAGKLEGSTEAQLEIVEKYETLANSMRDISENIRAEIFTKIEELEHKSLMLALEISKRVLSTTAEVKPEYILDVIRNGLKHLGASKPLKVRVSPQDFEFLEVVGLPEDLTMEGAKVQYIADENIASGCVVETDYGELNLELDKMWAEVKNNLFKAIS